ncbi:MAG: cytochrome b/b6 domain-containing protein [Candidatus Zixiibacteriota bacterium]
MPRQKNRLMKQYRLSLSVLLLILSLALFWVNGGYAATDEECLVCHGDKGLSKTDSTGKEKSLFVDQSVFVKSIHKDLGCTGCHQGVLPEPHATPPVPVDCGSCHQDATKLYQEGIHGQRKREGVARAPACNDCHSYHSIHKADDPEADTYRANQPKMCAKCHDAPISLSKYQIPLPAPYQAYMESVHGKSLKDGNPGVAVCSDCHKSHDIKPASDPSSLTYRTNISATCGQCHPSEQEEYAQDAHGSGVKRGVTDAPVCTDCHTEHAIKSSRDKTSSTFTANLSKITCTRCHSQERIIEKYGLVSQRFTTYLDSYHGVGSMAGDTTTASCASCHTSHSIRPQEDPLSSINKANLPHTCGKCHHGAGPNFAKGSIHIIPSRKTDIGVYWIRRLYLSLIVIVIGGMLAHNAVLMIKHARDRYRQAKGGTVVRFTIVEVIWHFLLMVSFTTLAITGFAFRYPDSWWSSWMTHSPAAFAARAVAHRVAAVVFIGLFVFSFGHSVFTRRGRGEMKAKFPVLSDIRNVIQNMIWSLGFSPREPLFDRYNYAEKAEYWALVWGGVVMVLTGIPLWFETFFLGFMPKWLLDVCKAIHFYEACLATLAIVVWHFFYMIVDPETYPVNFSFLTGTMTEEDYMKRHPLDYEKMIARGELADYQPEEPTEETQEIDEAEDQDRKEDL